MLGKGGGVSVSFSIKIDCASHLHLHSVYFLYFSRDHPTYSIIQLALDRGSEARQKRRQGRGLQPLYLPLQASCLALRRRAWPGPVHLTKRKLYQCHPQPDTSVVSLLRNDISMRTCIGVEESGIRVCDSCMNPTPSLHHYCLHLLMPSSDRNFIVGEPLSFILYAQTASISAKVTILRTTSWQETSCILQVFGSIMNSKTS